VQREPLERLQRYWGGSVRPRPPSKRIANASPYHRWLLCGARAELLALAILSDMSPRRKQQIRRMLVG